MVRKIFGWTGAVFFLAAIISGIAGVRVYGSELFVFYGLGLIGFVWSIAGRFWKVAKPVPETPLFRAVERVSFYGNLVITVFFFPPLLMLWGTLLDWLIAWLKGMLE
ncbi:hypothetical protein F9U64_06375 [Gracilibacillus oryzae]|uniref:MFS transporter n=1 Tax=Gracilibacillus oryzae TaxID=1672701 RepID=A0A7C8L8B4_9BACI|nr:hypothetical protein [Gracilibacillus oryzae]KAB8138069.1 hypothetical protein F9U64_06375 [Gracilibacillus oryzae]